MKQPDFSDILERIVASRAADAARYRTIEGRCPIHGAYSVKVLPREDGRYRGHAECPHGVAQAKTEHDRIEALCDTFARKAKAFRSLIAGTQLYQEPSATFEGFKAETPEKLRAKSIVMRFTNGFIEQQLTKKNPDCGLFLFGGSGNGKTHIAMACLDVLASKGVPIIFTTNLDGKELKACLDERIVSRIVAVTYPIHFSWPDVRKSSGYSTKSAEELFGEAWGVKEVVA